MALFFAEAGYFLLLFNIEHELVAIFLFTLQFSDFLIRFLQTGLQLLFLFAVLLFGFSLNIFYLGEGPGKVAAITHADQVVAAAEIV